MDPRSSPLGPGFARLWAASSTANLAGAAYLAVFVLWAVGDTSVLGLLPEGYGLLPEGYGLLVDALELLGLGTMPLGALLGGALGTALGLPPVFHTAAALCALAAAVTAEQLRDRRRPSPRSRRAAPGRSDR
jgi:hypothetical protein